MSDTITVSLQTPATTGSRRLKLWDLNHQCHCPLVGVCFDLSEIRKHVARLIRLPHNSTDFEIHVIAVRECEKRTPLSALLQKELDRRYSLDIQKAKQAKTIEQLQRHWRVAVEHGAIAGALWAICTHPQCSDLLRHEIYGEVHMLQHQVGTHQRAEQRMVRMIREENLRLGREIGELQERVQHYKDERDRELQELKAQLYEAVLERKTLERQLADAHEDLSLLKREQPMVNNHEIATQIERRQQSEEKAIRSREEAAALRQETADLRNDLQLLEETLTRTLAQQATPRAECNADCDACDLSNQECLTLNGYRVLCVGGLNQITPQYRQIVERLGGEFIHHDGGVEEKIGRLESDIAWADAVICQTGFVSHNAYWRVKDVCKKTNKPCAYVKKPSLTGFIRSLEQISKIESVTTETH